MTKDEWKEFFKNMTLEDWCELHVHFQNMNCMPKYM